MYFRRQALKDGTAAGLELEMTFPRQSPAYHKRKIKTPAWSQSFSAGGFVHKGHFLSVKAKNKISAFIIG